MLARKSQTWVRRSGCFDNSGMRCLPMACVELSSLRGFAILVHRRLQVADLPQPLAESAIWIRPFLAASVFLLVPGAELAQFPEGEGTNAYLVVPRPK